MKISEWIKGYINEYKDIIMNIRIYEWIYEYLN